MRVGRFAEVIKLLVEGGFEGEFLAADHDVIYLPVHDPHPVHEDFENKLKEAGAHWASEFDCWVVYC